jgi:peptide/nickel transport system substrate-binding protein
LTNRKSIVLSLFGASCALFLSCAPVSTSRSVNLPFPQIEGFHPAEWKVQQILSQGTLFEGLFGYAPEPMSLGGMKVVPLLAESWKNSPDGRVWTFRLRKGRKWSNGDPVTAYDFEWSFRYYCQRNTPEVPLWASALGSFSNAWNVRNGTASPGELGVRALNETSLRIVLDQPDYNLPLGLAAAATVPVHRTSIEQYPDSWWTPERLICNGPFVVQSFTQGRSCVLVRNRYWRGSRGNVESVCLRFEPDELSAYRQGRLDAAWFGANIRNPASFPRGSIVQSQTFDLSFRGYALTRSHSSALDDRRVRQAFAISVDRNALVAAVRPGQAVPAGSVWPKKTTIGRKIKSQAYQPEKARQLLVMAGYPEGRGIPPLKWFVPLEGDPTAEFIVKEWEKNIGIKVEIVRLAPAEFDEIAWNDSPNTPPGFFSFTGGMNYFSPGSLAKTMETTIQFYGYPAEIRQELWNYNTVLRRQIRSSTRGGILSDWDELIAQRDESSRQAEAAAAEAKKSWKKLLPTPVLIRSRFDRLFHNWESAATPGEKKAIWRTAAESLLDEQRDLFEYEQKSPHHKAMQKAFLDLQDMSWDLALRSAHKSLQMFQDECYIVPLYHDKLRFVHRANLRGLMVYKLAGGPAFFNYKLLNIVP